MIPLGDCPRAPPRGVRTGCASPVYAARVPTLLWSLLAVALHNSIATALDPTLDIAEGMFPVASVIDVWVRDPPAVSSLPAPGA